MYHGKGDDMAKHDGSGPEFHEPHSTFRGPSDARRSAERSSHGVDQPSLAATLRDQIAPSGPLESLIFGQILSAAEETRSKGGISNSSGLRRAERRLAEGIQALLDLRMLSTRSAYDHAIAEPAQVEQPVWSDRLSWEVAISDTSPTVRGTWITVDQVVSRIVDGWSWGDILRAHPELCEDDIRACLSYTVEEEGMG